MNSIVGVVRVYEVVALGQGLKDAASIKPVIDLIRKTE
jgi:hypothetical protein